MKLKSLVYWAILGVMLVFVLAQLSTAKPESLVNYAIMGVALVFALSWLSGRPPSLRWLREPTIWDVLSLAFGVSIPLIAQVIGDGFVASVVVVLAGLLLVLAHRRFGQPSAEAAR